MDELLEQGYFACYPNSFVYAERTLRNGAVRRGLIGTVDLEQYDYRKGSGSLIRATEGTVLERIPPRVKNQGKRTAGAAAHYAAARRWRQAGD